VKVGRAALDEDAIRRIEQMNPGVEFDWPRIIKGQGAPPTEARPPAEARRQRPRSSQSSPQPPASQRPAAVEAPQVEAPRIVQLEREAAPPPPAIAIPGEDVITAAHGRIGAEGVQRLRVRFAEILSRIAERAGDPQRQGELKAQAERLNPDAWLTDDDVTQGLEQYESVLASLRDVVGQRRRRRRRGKGPRTAEPAGGQADATDSEDSSDTSDPESPAEVSASAGEGSVTGGEPRSDQGES
jgi:hypothetical protein